MAIIGFKIAITTVCIVTRVVIIDAIVYDIGTVAVVIVSGV